MYKELTLFDGGINNLIATHLISENQSPFIQNAKINSGVIMSQREKVETSRVVNGKYGFYYRAKDQVITSDEDRFFVEWGGFLYWSNSAGTLKRYDGTTINDIGSHTAPSTAPSALAGTNGLLNGDYFYTITYVHDGFFESPPSGFTQITVANKAVNLTISGTPPTSATSLKIYRSGGINPSFNLLVELPIATTSYADNISDFSISREELATYSNYTPPANIDMLIETGGVFFGAVGNKVYFSNQGQPEYWNPYHYVQLPSTVTGLGAKGGSVIIFTNSSMYQLSGTSLSDISLIQLPFSFGCKHKRTVQNVYGSLVWVAEIDENDVICVYDGGSVTIANMYATSFNRSTIESMAYDDINETYNDYNFNIKNSLSAFNKYYLFTTNRTVIVDFVNSAKVYYSYDNIDSAYAIGNNVFAIENLKEYNYTSQSFGKYRNFVFTTKDLIDGMVTQTKSYRMVKISCVGTVELTIKVDDRTIMTTTDTKIFLPSGITGYKISFYLKSVGHAIVNAIMYEYELLKE